MAQQDQNDNNEFFPHASPPPNPDDFSSFEEYEEALEIYEIFMEKSQEVSKALENVQSEDEMEVQMQAMGFEKFELPICDGDWCQENSACLASVLDDFQSLANEHFFWQMMPEEEKLLKITEGVQDICEIIPPHWKKQNSRERQTIDFCLELLEEIVVNNKGKKSYEDIMNNNSVQEFGRNMYLMLHRTLFPQKENEVFQKAVKNFLKENNVLKKTTSRAYLKRLENSVNF